MKFWCPQAHFQVPMRFGAVFSTERSKAAVLERVGGRCRRVRRWPRREVEVAMLGGG
jgi:hypothetical protein